MKDIKILFSSLLIFTSFFLGIYYEKSGDIKIPDTIRPLYVNLVQKSNGFEIVKNDENIHILINGKDFNGTGIILEKKPRK